MKTFLKTNQNKFGISAGLIFISSFILLFNDYHALAGNIWILFIILFVLWSVSWNISKEFHKDNRKH